tara:strand:+ start:3038 stop:3559 length:522 start_codon:yes stop_codon:yes gene_type:complete
MSTSIPNMRVIRRDKYQEGSIPIYGYQEITESLINNNEAPLPVGVAVISKAKNSYKGVALPEVGTTAEKIVGFTIIDQTHVIAKSAIEGWVENKACSIFKSGKIHLRAAKGAKEGENVHVYVSAGKFGQIAGGAADSADGASTVELLGCKWQENVEVGQVGPVVVTNLTYKAS